MSRQSEARNRALYDVVNVRKYETTFGPSDVKDLLSFQPFVIRVNQEFQSPYGPGEFSVYRMADTTLRFDNPITPAAMDMAIPELAYVHVLESTVPMMPNAHDLRSMGTAGYGMLVQRDQRTFEKQLRIMNGVKLTSDQLEAVRRMRLDIFEKEEYEELLRNFGITSILTHGNSVEEQRALIESLPSVTVPNQI